MVSVREKSIILGTVLGDAHLSMLKTGARLEVGHSQEQKQYLFWKYQELKRFSQAKPHFIEFFDKRYNKNYFRWKFNTKVDDFFSELHCKFYKNKKKIVPKEIFSLIKDPLTLAVWFMDDGGRRNDCFGLFINSLSFTKRENEILAECLRKNFFLNSRLHWVKDGYRLYIPSKYAKKFCELVYPYIIPEMRYKLSYNPVTTSFARLDRARDRGK